MMLKARVAKEHSFSIPRLRVAVQDYRFELAQDRLLTNQEKTRAPTTN
jgi:hypothetical protein